MQTCTRPILPAEVAVAVSAPPTTRVSVVIPCLDEAETIAECVTAARDVLAESHLDGEVIVVDNGSTDGSVERVRDELPWVRLITNRHNRGLAAANNQGLIASRAPFVRSRERPMRAVASMGQGRSP